MSKMGMTLEIELEHGGEEDGVEHTMLTILNYTPNLKKCLRL